MTLNFFSNFLCKKSVRIFSGIQGSFLIGFAVHQLRPNFTLEIPVDINAQMMHIYAYENDIKY